MKSFIPLFPFAAALALIACHGDDGPVAEDAAAPPDNVIGDAAADGPAAPANAAAAEATARAAVPVAQDGLAWSSAQGGAVATFGAGPASPMLRLACEGAGGARHLLVTRFHPAHPGKTATISFTGAGHASSLPAHAVAKAGGPGESEWQSEARGDMARAVARAFSVPGLVNVTLGGAPSLVVPASPVVRAVFQRCA